MVGEFIEDSMILFVEDEEVEDGHYELPAVYEVCNRCNGTGKHVNPNIDGDGLPYEAFYDDPDFEEAYFRGDYDVTCYECGGKRVVPVVAQERIERFGTEELKANLKLYLSRVRGEMSYLAMCRMERMMGA